MTPRWAAAICLLVSVTLGPVAISAAASATAATMDWMTDAASADSAGSAQGPWVFAAGTAVAVSTTLAPEAGQTKSVIPRPNSGSAPQASGDRGGTGQLALLGLLLLAMIVVGAVVIVSTMRTTRSRTPNP